MESCDALLAAIDDFEGTVVMVTHNEMFLHALAERLVIFQGGGIEVFEGGYQEFLDQGGWLEENLSESGRRRRAAPEESSKPKPSKKALRRERSTIISEKSRRLAPLKKQIDQLENGHHGTGSKPSKP